MDHISYGGVLLKSIPGMSGYFISACGTVIVSMKHSPMRRLSIQANNCGYLKSIFEGKGHLVHRLVALAWVDGDHSLVVNHIDGDKRNNHYSNLEWITHYENYLHAIRMGRGNPERPIIGVNPITGEGVWIKSLAHSCALGHSRKCISKVMSGERRQHHGYVWMHADSPAASFMADAA